MHPSSSIISPWAVLIACLIFLHGCANVYRPQNEPAEKIINPQQGYRIDHPDRNMGETLIILSFSGGGTRAAAFSYGAMKTLRDTQIITAQGKGRLLDEVDVISSVSGGSFTAAYYGLHGDRLFKNYEDKFLKQSIQGALIRKLFNPTFWFRSLFRGLDRTEIAVEYYDTYIFEGATFKDIPQKNRPFIEINTTDLNGGNRFSFTQRYFDLICSDLDQFNLARAVTASSAVPILFPSVVLKNHASECDISHVALWQELENNSLTRDPLIQHLRSYRDEKNRPYIHLVDGGITDNLGLRAITDRLEVMNYSPGNFDPFSKFKTVAIILINAETRPRRSIDDSAHKPGISKTLAAVSSAQIKLYNAETLSMLRNQIEINNEQARAASGEDKFHFIEINFEAIASREIKDLFNALPTSLALSSEQVDRLIKTGGDLLEDSPDFRNLVTTLNQSTVTIASDKQQQ